MKVYTIMIDEERLKSLQNAVKDVADDYQGVYSAQERKDAEELYDMLQGYIDDGQYHIEED